MDLSIDRKCPACGAVAGASRSSVTTSSESYDTATFGLSENVASALCYVLAWVTGIIFILVEKENKTVRFHAMQSILTFLPLGILAWIVGLMGYAFAWIGGLILLVEFILWIVLIIKAYQGEKFMVPIVGPIAAKELE